MNCEQVEELLSAYLDDTLAIGETTQSAQQLKTHIEAHLENCIHCRTILADYQRFDTLLAHLPRALPGKQLRDRIFSSAEYTELTGTDNISLENADNFLAQEQTSLDRRRASSSRPKLIALPGGRHTSSSPIAGQSAGSHPTEKRYVPQPHKQRRAWGLWTMQAAIAAALLLTVGVGSLIAWNIWRQQQVTALNTKAITPPAGPAGNVPLSAGMHLVFLRDGALWSVPSDGSTHAVQLTPQGVTVAPNWIVSSPLPGRDAGDMLAYIDLQQARVHILRSDGLRDTVVSLPLLKSGIAPSSVWDTSLGEAILTGLAWSKDGSMLAFVADPTGRGSTSLYLLSTDTGSVQTVSLPTKGSVARPVWSPDGIRVAFEVTQNGTTGILDYNVQNHGFLVITHNVTVPGSPNDTLLTIAWTADTSIPALTWSVGVPGHVHSIWLRYVGVGGSATSKELVHGDYRQASYSSNGHNGIGSCLLLATTPQQTINLLILDTLTGVLPIAISYNKHIAFAQWSPDGTQIDYLDNLASGVGTLHIVNATTGSDMLIASGVTNQPQPAWSKDSQHLLYSTGTQTVVANIQGGRALEALKLRGTASAFTWSATSVSQAIVALSDGQTGLYLVDTAHNTSAQIDAQGITGPLWWTEIP